jgi:hypothetical protein
MKRRDISDLEVCKAVAEYKRTRGDFPYEALARKFKCDEKLAFSACERAYRNGLIEYGVSLRTGWLTEKGEGLIAVNVEL